MDRQARRLSSLGLILSVLRTVALTIGVIAAGALISSLISIEQSSAQTSAISPLWMAPFIVCAASFTVVVIAQYCGEWAQDTAERVLQRDVRGRLFARLDTASNDDGDLPAEGDFADLATSDVDRYATFRAEFHGSILAALLAPVIVLVIIAVSIDAPLAGMLTLLVVLVTAAVGGFQRLTRKSMGGWRRREASLAVTFLQGLQGLRTLSLFGAGDRYLARLARSADEQRTEVMKLLAVNQLLILVLDALFYAGVLTGSALLAAWRLESGAIDAGQATAVVLLAVVMSAPLDVVGKFFYLRAQGRRAEQRLARVVSQPTAAHRHEQSGGSPSSTQTLVSIQSGRLVTPGGRQLSHDLNLSIDRGERLAITGPSGVGKSTLLGVLAERRQLGAGSRVSAERIRIVEVMQNPVIFSGTLRDNLALGATVEQAADDARCWRALELSGLATVIRERDDGLDTRLGERGDGLSGGQRQRLAVARALMTDVDLLLLDEPTSGLDFQTARRLVEILGALPAPIGVVCVTHDPDAFRGCMRLARLDAEGITLA